MRKATIIVSIKSLYLNIEKMIITVGISSWRETECGKGFTIVNMVFLAKSEMWTRLSNLIGQEIELKKFKSYLELK